jgi:hypothetical protein
LSAADASSLLRCTAMSVRLGRVRGCERWQVLIDDARPHCDCCTAC